MEMITKILLADSSEEFRLLLRHTLEDTGEFQIVGDTGDGEAAWELIQQTQPDIVVMDVILPGLDGVSLLQRMPKNVKTIVLSAFCSQNMVQEVMRLGAWYFIPKPAHMDSLLERIREAAVPENGALALPTLEADVTAIIDGSQLSDGAKRRALAIFTALAAAEAKAHGKTPETVMFHEVGAVDSIVDVCSVAICLDDLGIEDIVVESLSEGHGTIRCAHGLMPIPVPAVVNLCQAGNIALTPAPVAGELVTPTGAAIVTALRTSDQLPPRYRIEAVGYGAGKRPYEGCSGTLRCLLVHADA